ncbi:hypothetical protein PhaeoP83_04499 (plasmid) [Phaeobacter inhibens]|jgi:hypothetical protein|uniref:hypothetical protein n=1 Tax=Phaeobacter inhibens TaxID=221822 RepID=UPI000C9A4820|nr:hypothetical protein [Phaeobacter inhibens]AUQ52717.1 hypothetical protein PhaeoP83_04499 [Phaeobacter inhibens]
MSKDPFQELVDELTALRRSIEHIARTSLDKDEAKTLNQAVAQAALKMAKATKDAPGEIQEALASDRDQMARSATQAATRAAESAMAGIRHDLDNERAKLSQAAGEARREAWRWFGGFWVWLASMLATGAVIGALAMAWIQGRGDAREFGQFPSIYCSTAGGQVVEQDNGSSYCAIWINRPEQ